MSQPPEGKSNLASDYHPWSTYVDAREEAKVRGDRRVGTEHLAVALLMEVDLAEALGCDPPAARAALHAMDRAALAAVGLDGVLEELPPTTPPAPERAAKHPSRPTVKQLLLHRLPMTPAAKAVLRDSSRDMRRPGRGHPGPRHVLGALLELRPPDPAAELFQALGVDLAKARQRLRAAG